MWLNYILQWYQNLISVDRSAISGIFYNCVFQCNFYFWGKAKKRISGLKNQILISLYNRYFCHLTLLRWSRISKNPSERAILEVFLFQVCFPLNSLLEPSKFKVLEMACPGEQFGNRSCYLANCTLRIALIKHPVPQPIWLQIVSSALLRSMRLTSR